MTRRVGVTGIGLVTGLGVGTDATWKAILEGRSAVAPLEGFSTDGLTSRIGSQVGTLDPEAYGAARRNTRTMTPGDRFAYVAATLALRDAGFSAADDLPRAYPDSDRLALYAAGDKEVGRITGFEEAVKAARKPDGEVDVRVFAEVGMNTVYPLIYVEGLPGASLFYISQTHKMTGANTYFSGSSDTGLIAIGTAFRTIRRGEADLAIAGAYDDGLTPLSMNRFDSFGILTYRNDLGPAACRPYDRDRTGSVMGEGAVFFVLEEMEAAKARSARVYAEVCGYGAAFDGYRLVTPDPEGGGTRRAIEAALKDGAVAADDVGYVATHGSATLLGDVTETAALKAAFGEHARRLAASTVKPATGHMTAAAGPLSLATAVLAIHDGVLPPTLNLAHPDPACDLDWVPLEARSQRVRFAVAVGRGFEGTAAAIAARAVQ